MVIFIVEQSPPQNESPESADNDDCNACRGGHSEWRPIINDEAGGRSTMISAVFSCVLRAANGLSYGPPLFVRWDPLHWIENEGCCYPQSRVTIVANEPTKIFNLYRNGHKL